MAVDTFEAEPRLVHAVCLPGAPSVTVRTATVNAALRIGGVVGGEDRPPEDQPPRRWRPVALRWGLGANQKLLRTQIITCVRLRRLPGHSALNQLRPASAAQPTSNSS